MRKGFFFFLVSLIFLETITEFRSFDVFTIHKQDSHRGFPASKPSLPYSFWLFRR